MKILAFPSMGKTPLSLKSGKYLDLDFGHFRESLNVQKDDEQKLMKPFAKLMEMYEHDGFVVLSNDPKLLDYSHFSRMFVPRAVQRAAKKLGVSEDVARSWVDDWIRAAKQHNVPVTVLNVGLDHYLLSQRKTRKEAMGNEASTSVTTIR